MRDRRACEIDAAWTSQRLYRDARGRIMWRACVPWLIEMLSAQQNHRCCHCGFRTNEATTPDRRPTIEHVVPLSMGGRDLPSNLAMACHRCNQERRNDETWTPRP